jgi:hypothetical protein
MGYVHILFFAIKPLSLDVGNAHVIYFTLPFSIVLSFDRNHFIDQMIAIEWPKRLVLALADTLRYLKLTPSQLSKCVDKLLQEAKRVDLQVLLLFSPFYLMKLSDSPCIYGVLFRT